MSLIMISKTDKGKSYLCTVCKHTFIRGKKVGSCPDCLHELNLEYANKHPLPERYWVPRRAKHG
jgi:hypothetical protein